MGKMMIYIHIYLYVYIYIYGSGYILKELRKEQIWNINLTNLSYTPYLVQLGFSQKHLRGWVFLNRKYMVRGISLILPILIGNGRNICDIG